MGYDGLAWSGAGELGFPRVLSRRPADCAARDERAVAPAMRRRISHIALAKPPESSGVCSSWLPDTSVGGGSLPLARKCNYRPESEAPDLLPRSDSGRGAWSCTASLIATMRYAEQCTRSCCLSVIWITSSRALGCSFRSRTAALRNSELRKVATVLKKSAGGGGGG